MYYGHLNNPRVTVSIDGIKKAGNGYRAYFSLNGDLKSVPLSESIFLIANLGQGYFIKDNVFRFINANIDKKRVFNILAIRIQNDIKAGLCTVI